MTGWDEAAAAFTAGGVVVAAGALWAQLVQRREEFAQRYNERYWALRDGQPAGEPLGTNRRYLELCEDEFDAVRLGWVRGSTWEVWHAAITTAVKHIPVSTTDSQLRLLRRCVEASHHTTGWSCPSLQLSRWRVFRLRVAGSSARRTLDMP